MRKEDFNPRKIIFSLVVLVGNLLAPRQQPPCDEERFLENLTNYHGCSVIRSIYIYGGRHDPPPHDFIDKNVMFTPTGDDDCSFCLVRGVKSYALKKGDHHVPIVCGFF